MPEIVACHKQQEETLRQQLEQEGAKYTVFATNGKFPCTPPSSAPKDTSMSSSSPNRPATGNTSAAANGGVFSFFGGSGGGKDRTGRILDFHALSTPQFQFKSD